MQGQSHYQQIVRFLRGIGISVREEPLTVDTFLPGIMLDKGELIVDPDQLQYPGDILHEAGMPVIMCTSGEPA